MLKNYNYLKKNKLRDNHFNYKLDKNKTWYSLQILNAILEMKILDNILAME